MGALFAKKHSSRVNERDKAVLQLKQTRDRMKQYQRNLERSLEGEKLLARELLRKGQKDRALILLRKKKFQEQLLVKTDNQLENLELMVHDLEFAEVEIKVVDGLKVGNVALKKLNDLLRIEDVERIMDETREGVEKQNEINEALMGELTAQDEDDVEEELNALLADVESSEKEIVLPEVPVDEPEKQKDRAKMKESDPVMLEA